jgi:hypothetical protein
MREKMVSREVHGRMKRRAMHGTGTLGCIADLKDPADGEKELNGLNTAPIASVDGLSINSA